MSEEEIEIWNTFSFNEKVQMVFSKDEIQRMDLDPKKYGYR